jgi:hypothetical protein
MLEREDGIDDPISDDELTALALAADPDQPLAPDAVPFSVLADGIHGPLPDWYMPTAVARRRGRGHAVIVLAIIAASLGINALGYCITYGRLVFA